MKITLNAFDLVFKMDEAGRNYYSEEGLEALLDHYDDIDENMEFDPVAICCDCTEYGNRQSGELGKPCGFSDLISDYGYLISCDGYSEAQWDDLSDEEQDKILEELLEALEERTTVFHLDNGNIIVFLF